MVSIHADTFMVHKCAHTLTHTRGQDTDAYLRPALFSSRFVPFQRSANLHAFDQTLRRYAIY